MNDKSSFLRNSLMNFGGNIITIILGLVTSIIIARTLGPSGQGIFTLVILLPTMLVTFMNFGIAPATVFYIGRAKYSMNTVISTNIILGLLISIAAVVLGIGSAFLFQGTFFEGVPLNALLAVLLVLPFLFYNSFLQAIYQGTQNFERFNAINISGKLIQVLFLLIMILIFNLSLEGAIISFVIGTILPAIIITGYMRKDKVKFKIAYFSAELTKDCIRYGYKAHLSNIVSFLNYRVDILMISFFLNPIAVGIYNVAVSIAERLWVFSGPISTALFPRISSIKSEKERTDLTVMVTRNVLYFSILFGLVFLLFSDLAVFLLFGKEYEAASNVIRILLIGITLFAAERILSNDLAGRGKPEINLYTTLFTLSSNIILNIILIPKYGINGAAVSTTISYSLTFVLKLLIFSKLTSAKIGDMIIFKKEDLKNYKKLIQRITKRKRAS